MSLTLQAGAQSFDGSVDPKLGIVAIKLKCHATSLVEAVTGDAPQIGVTGLVENQPRTFSRRAGGENEGYDVNITLEGHLNPDAADGEEFTLEGTTSEDPIESNPRYTTLLEVYNGKEDASGRAKWPKTFGEEGARNPMHGVENYLTPGLTWTRRYTSTILSASIVRTLGTIEQPPGNPPEISGNRNWLKIRARARWRGNVWEIEETWLLSGPDGWVPEMYRYE